MSLNQKLSEAQKAQPGFQALGFKKRAKLLKKAGFALLKRFSESAELCELEAYKPYPEILLSEAIGPLQYIKDWIKVAKPFLKPQPVPIPAMAFPRKKATRTQVPRGVVGIITPFNYPFGNFFKPVFAALLCGNSVIIKPSEHTPKTADWFVNIMNQFLPEGVLQLHHGAGEAGEELILSGIDAVTFTGSFQTGQKVAQLAAGQMIPCSFELGGKDAALVLSDCDLDRTSAGILHWAFHNAGQSCGAIDRVYVESEIADNLVLKLSKAGAQLGGMVNRVVPLKHNQVLQELLQDAIQKGAVLTTPTDAPVAILDHCNHSMRIMKEPTFGPLLPIMRVENAEEAMQWVNDSDYGLCGSVWSEDIKRATKLAESFQVGTAYVNNHSFTGAIPAAPWTGVKQSGYGIANSEFSLAHYTRPFTVVIDRKRSADAWWFPMNRVAAKLGECLAKAQLGNIKAALQIPFLISKRQKQVLDFIRTPKSLFGFEARWGQAIMESLVIDPNNSKLQAVENQQAEEFMHDLYFHIPQPGKIGLRAAIWMIGLAPIWKRKALRSIAGIKPELRLKILEEIYESPSYIQRQLAMLMKLNGSFLHTSTTRFHQALKDASRPSA